MARQDLAALRLGPENLRLGTINLKKAIIYLRNALPEYDGARWWRFLAEQFDVAFGDHGRVDSNGDREAREAGCGDREDELHDDVGRAYGFDGEAFEASMARARFSSRG
jgi:hypothetical protein